MRNIEEIKKDLESAKDDLEQAEKEVYFQEMARNDCKVYVKEFEQELAMHNNQT